MITQEQFEQIQDIIARGIEQDRWVEEGADPYEIAKDILIVLGEDIPR